MLHEMSDLETVPLTCPDIVHIDAFGVDFICASDTDVAQERLHIAMRQQTYHKIKELRAVLRKQQPVDIDFLLSKLDDSDARVRWIIAKALGQLLIGSLTTPDARVQYALEHLENDHDSRVRAKAMAAGRAYKRAKLRYRIIMQTRASIQRKKRDIHQDIERVGSRAVKG